ncbi:A kinase (PRKA) anchor protein 1b [Genypterus blacodes]|uniref:A kinase (PRKA) anchor protein 1b n=1 Tax=Genypterus blacodes TaxID=154954 RepID=UPI003F75BFC0
MPLRFRSVVPYTLPGVIALIGWWWYISRKKQRLTNHDSPEGSPPIVGLPTSPAETSNGLVEKGTASPTTDTRVSPTNTPPLVIDQRTEPLINSQTHLVDNEASFLLEQCLEDEEEGETPHLGRMRTEEVHKLSTLTVMPPCMDESSQVSLKDHQDPDKSLAPALITAPEIETVKDEPSAPEPSVETLTLPCQSALFAEVTSASCGAVDLFHAERPEPEGEVAKHHITTATEDEMVVCAVTPAKSQRAITSEVDSLDTPVLAQGFHQHTFTSTPSSPTPIQGYTAPPLAQEDSRINSTNGEEQELELLAAVLITEVISAATQEVLGVTSCQLMDSQPNCSSSMPLASGRPCYQQEPITAAQQHQTLLSIPSPTGCGFREVQSAEKDEQRMTNGCSLAWEPVEVSHRVNTQRDRLPAPLHQASPGASLLSMKLTADKGGTLAEDSACSTCHSEDGVSSEDYQSSLFDNKMDLLQVTDMSETSARDVTAPGSLAETSAEASVLAFGEETSVDAVCHIKRLNGIGLRNGAHGTSEVETDQSGGSDVNSMDSVDSGCTMGAGDSQSNHAAPLGSELVIWEIEVPKHLVGRLIGKQGRYVSFLKQNSGAKIYISTLPYTQEFQICHIEGTQQQVDKALSLIGKKFKDLDLTNLYAPPPPPLTLPSLPMTSWLLLPSGVTVEVIVVNIVSAGHVFVQQHTHPTYHALRSLDQQMFLCYSQPGTPALPSPAEVGVICAAPAVDGAWWRAQVITFYKETNEVEIRYVDYGGYDRIKIDTLRQIRSDFVTLPFQGAEVLLDNIAPLPGEDRFSAEATSALEEMTRGVALLAEVTNYDNNTGLPLVQLWNMVGEEAISVNRSLAERGLGVWVDGF